MMVPLGCQVGPVFARNCYTRIFQASIENLKDMGRILKMLSLNPGRLGYFPIANLYRVEGLLA